MPGIQAPGATVPYRVAAARNRERWIVVGRVLVPLVLVGGARVRNRQRLKPAIRIRAATRHPTLRRMGLVRHHAAAAPKRSFGRTDVAALGRPRKAAIQGPVAPGDFVISAPTFIHAAQCQRVNV